ncbi:MAG: SGNH/GDSL hydrolase family protein [Roseateles sp.]
MKPSPRSTAWRRLILLAAGLGCAALAQAQAFSNLYVFGDSLSDVGNDLIVTGGVVPSPAFYSQGSITGRFTNGLSYADRLATGLGLALRPSLQGGSNYAFGGARVSSVASGLPPTALSFNQQIAAFDAAHALADPSALYVLWIGANDMSDAIGAAARGHSGAVGSAVADAMQGIGGAITDLSARGARHFLVPNLPDLAVIPAITGLKSAGLSALAHTASVSFNDALAATLSQPGFTALDIRRLDVFGSLAAVTAQPASFGFANVTDACYSGEVNGAARPGGSAPTVCANPASFVFWDYEHPTASMHALLGAQVLAAAVPEPATALLLGLGLAALAWRRVPRRD